MSARLLIKNDDGKWWEVDLVQSDSSPITTTHRRGDMKELGKPRSSFAGNIVLSGSPRTLRALNYGHRLDQDAGSTKIGAKFDALYLEDGVDVLDGPAVLEIQEITTSNEVVLFQCYLTGGRYRWLQDIQDIEYRDCDLGIHTFSYANVTASWDKATNGRFINGVYLPINYGTWIQPPATVQLVEIEFSPYIKSIIEKAHEAVGWKVEGGPWWEDVCESLIMPHVGNLVKGNTGDKDGVRPKTINLRREFKRTQGESVPTCLDGGVLNPERLRRFEIVPGSEINCSTTMLSDTRGLVRCTPPDNEFVGQASFQYNLYCDPDGLAGGGAETLLGVYTAEFQFEDPFISADYDQVVAAEMSVPILGEQIYDTGDFLRLPSDFYETHVVQRGTVQHIDENTRPKPPFSPSPQYGKDQEGAYTVPFDGTYSIWLNLQTTRSDLSSIWYIQIISDQRGIMAFATINAATYDNIVLQDQFLNEGEILTFKVVRDSGTGTLTLINKDSDAGALPEDIPTVYPAFRLECAPKISITPAADGNFYDAFPQDYQVVASHAYKNFKVADMMAGLQQAFNLEFIPDNEQKVLYIYKETETTNSELPPVDISQFIREGAEIKEKTPPANNSGSISIQDDGTICTDVRFRWKPDSKDGYVEYYQDVSGDQYLHGDRVDPGECVVENENPFFSPTALQLSYMGIDPEEVDGFSPSYPGDLPDIKQYMMWFLTMQPDQEEPDFYELSIEIIKDPSSFSWDDITDDELWEGRVTHDYNHRIAYFEGLVDPQADNDYFDDWFLLGTFAAVGFNLRYWDGATYVENNLITSQVPYAYMIDLWNENPLSPSLSFKKEKYGNPAYFTTEFVKANVDLFQTISRTVTKSLRADSWPNTLRRFQGGRYFEVPVGLSLPDLQGLLSLDRRKYFTHPELGMGVFYLDAIRNFNQRQGTAILELWQEEPTCETGNCLPGLSALDADFTATKQPVTAEVSFGVSIDNTITDIITIVDTPFTIYNGYDNTVLSTGTIDGSALLLTGVQSFGAVTLAGAGFPTSTYGEPNFKVNIKGSIQYYNKDGELCGYPFCYQYEAIISDVSETVVYTTFDGDCRIPPPMFDSFTCFETVSGLGSFPNKTKSEMPLSNLEDNFDNARKWRFDELYINGAPILEKYWGTESTWWQNSFGNIGYIQAVNDGTNAPAAASAANNTENFFKWFNSLFAYAAQDIQGFPTEFESPVYFRPSGDRILSYVSNEFPGNVILKLSKFTDLVDANPAFQYELQYNTAGGSGLMQVKNGVTAVTEIAYTIQACTALPEPDLATQYCELYGNGLLGGVGVIKFTDLTSITGFASGRLRYIIEHFEVDLGGNLAASEDISITTGGATLGSGTYQGVALPEDLINFFNQQSYVHPTAFRFTDGGLFYEHNDNKAYRISIREEIYEADQITLSSTWRYILDTQTGFVAGDASTVTTADFGTPLLTNTCTDMLSLENTPPTVSDIIIAGTGAEGQTIGINSYTYSDVESDLEDTSDPNRVEWFSYPTYLDAQNNTNATSLGTGLTFLLNAGQIGTWVRATYTPYALTGGSPGVATLSDTIVGPIVHNSGIVTFTTDDTIFNAEMELLFSDKVIVDWGDGSMFQVFDFTLNVPQIITHNYGSSADRTVTIFGEATYLTRFDTGGQSSTVKGNFDISSLDSLVYLDLAGSTGLTSVSIGPSTAVWEHFDLTGTSGYLSSLSWASQYSWVPTTLKLANSAISGFSIGTHAQNIEEVSAYPTVNVAQWNFAGISTMSGILDVGGGSLVVIGMPGGSSAPFSLIRVKDDDTLTTLDFSWVTHTVTDYCIEDVTALTTLTDPSAAISGVYKVTGNTALNSYTQPTVASTVTALSITGSPVLTTIDISNFTVNGVLDLSSNFLLNTLTPPAGGAYDGITLNAAVGYVDFTAGTLTAAAVVNFDNRNLTAAQVNQTLEDLYNMSVYLGIGNASGSISIQGTNAGPDNSAGGVDGFHQVLLLQTLGWTVNVNTPSTTAFSYTTTYNGSHSPNLGLSASTALAYDWGDGNGVVYASPTTNHLPSVTYPDGTSKTVTIYGDPLLFTYVRLNNEELDGTLDISSLTNLEQVRAAFCPALTEVVFPVSSAWTEITINSSGLTVCELPVGTVFNDCLFNVEANAITTLDYNNITGTFSRWYVKGNSFAGAILMENVAPSTGVGPQIQFQNNPGITDIDHGVQTGVFNQYQIASSDITTFTIPFTPGSNSNNLVRAQASSLTNIAFTSGGGDYLQLWLYSMALSGTLDLSTITFSNGGSGQILAFSNGGLTDINHGTGKTGTIRDYRINACNVGYHSLGGRTLLANCTVNLENNSFTAAETNEWLYNLDPTAGGEALLPATASGGTIDISGSNAAPDTTSGGFDGDASAANIVTAGYTLTTT